MVEAVAETGGGEQEGGELEGGEPLGSGSFLRGQQRRLRPTRLTATTNPNPNATQTQHGNIKSDKYYNA